MPVYMLTDSFDELLESALRAYEKNYYLEVTGILDSDAITNKWWSKDVGTPYYQ